MKKLNSAQIKDLIDKLPLDDSNKSKVAKIFAKVLPESIFCVPSVGEVWITDAGRVIIATNENCGIQIDDFFPFKNSKIDEIPEGNRFLGFAAGPQQLIASFWMKKLADSPFVYFNNREAILKKLRKELPE